MGRKQSTRKRPIYIRFHRENGSVAFRITQREFTAMLVEHIIRHCWLVDESGQKRMVSGIKETIKLADAVCEIAKNVTSIFCQIEEHRRENNRYPSVHTVNVICDCPPSVVGECSGLLGVSIARRWLEDMNIPTQLAVNWERPADVRLSDTLPMPR